MRYYVEMEVSYQGWIEADSHEEAEALAYTSYGDTMDCDLIYDGVVAISVDEDPEPEEEEDADVE